MPLDLKREGKKLGKGRVWTLVDRVKKTTARALPSMSLELMIHIYFL